ncbi:alpha/beta hydrolase [Pseudomonas aeruginosa]
MTSLADDAERTRKMIAQQQGPVLLVGHSYGGAVITEAGNQPNVVGLVYIAAFRPRQRRKSRWHHPGALAPGRSEPGAGQRWLSLGEGGQVPRKLLPGSRCGRRAGHGHHPEGSAGQHFRRCHRRRRPGRASPPGTRFPAPIA